MSRLKDSSVFWFMLVGFLAFWPMLYGFGSPNMTEITASLVLGASLAIALTWAAAALIGAKNGLRDGETLLSLGIFFLAFSLFLQRVWFIAIRWSGRPHWMIESPINSFSAWSIFCACTLILLAPGTTAGAVPHRNWLYVAAAACFGSLVSGITIGVFLANV